MSPAGALRIGSLCSGGGGLDLAAEAVYAARTVWHVENDPGASAVLAARWPGVPNHGDLTTVNWAQVEPVDILTTGFPCQDISYAGKRAGLTPGTRSGLWAHVARGIAALRPQLVIIENVRGLLSARAHSELEPCPHCVGDLPGKPALRALGAVLGELAALGYDACWQSVPAAAVGAPHLRWRVFVLAWPADTPGPRLETWRQGRPGTGPAADPVRGRRDRRPRTPLRNQIGGAPTAGGGPETGETPEEVTTLLPTPVAAFGRSTGAPSRDTAADRYAAGKRCLDDAVALLPTPRARDGKGRDPNPKGVDLNEAVALLPTPRATDGTKGGPGQRGSSGDLMLPSAVVLLPTPTAADSRRGSRNATAAQPGGTRSNTGGWTLADVAHTDRWGQYAAAIARWEHILGRPAPEPTEPGAKGRPRLSPRFVEWMMGLPDGWVTDPAIWAHHARPAGVRNAQLRILGNGVVPQQAAAAVCPPPWLAVSPDVCA